MARKRDGSQRELVFDCTQRDTILREMRLPRLKTEDGIAVRDITAQIVLYKINSHAGRGMAWPSIETLRRECGNVSERTIRRAINALAHAKILGVERRRLYSGERISGNHYCIDWQELLRYCRDCPAINRTFERDQSDIPAASNGHALAAKAPTKAGTKPPPTPKESEVEAAIAQAGIGNSKECAKAMLARGLSGDAAIEQVRVGQATIAKLSAARKLKSPVGALHWFLTTGAWPVDMPADAGEQRSHKDDDAAYWPIIRAMSREEQAALMPDDSWRDDLWRLGADNAQIRFMLVAGYKVTHGQRRLAVAATR